MTAAMKLKEACSLEEKLWPTSKAMVYFSSHVCMWELDYKESWVQKNWCFWTVVLEKTLESPLHSKEIQPVHPKGNQSWIYIGSTDAEAPILSPPDVKKCLIGKYLDAGKDWRQEEKGMTEDELVGWHHQLDGQEFGLAVVHGFAKSGTWLRGWTELYTWNYSKVVYQVWKSLSHVKFFATPWTIQSMQFSRPEYWSG